MISARIAANLVATVPVGQQVNPKLTALTTMELAKALISAHVALFGKPPSANRFAVAWAQCALETGRGALTQHFNFGNITPGPHWTGDYFTLKVPPPDPATLRFRAYATAFDGAEDYWRFLTHNYANALPAFDAGDATAAAVQLGARKWFLISPAVYGDRMGRLVREFNSKFVAFLPQPT